MTTPLTVGLLALIIKRKRKIPFYFEGGDLWPEAAVQMGIIRNPVLSLWFINWKGKFIKNLKR